MNRSIGYSESLFGLEMFLEFFISDSLSLKDFQTNSNFSKMAASAVSTHVSVTEMRWIRV